MIGPRSPKPPLPACSGSSPVVAKPPQTAFFRQNRPKKTARSRPPHEKAANAFPWPIVPHQHQKCAPNQNSPRSGGQNRGHIGLYFPQKNVFNQISGSQQNPGVLRGFPGSKTSNWCPVQTYFPSGEVPARVQDRVGFEGYEKNPG
jgi:hypothetical protein